MRPGGKAKYFLRHAVGPKVDSGSYETSIIYAPGTWGYKWVTLSLYNINTESWFIMLGLGSKAGDLAQHKKYFYEAQSENRIIRLI
jgi:hypothetical protein